jgi:hypothetical protein
MSIEPAVRSALKVVPKCIFPKDTEWIYHQVPLQLLVSEAIKDRFARGHKTFEDFHKDFISNVGWPPLWARRKPDFKWAIVLTGPPGGPYRKNRVIADGWHRLNWYVDRYGPEELIPVVWPA